MSCDNALSAANTCVNSDAACSTCFDPSSFMDTFPADAELFFRSSLPFKPPTDPEFCVEANWRVCKKFNPAENGEASCCCIQETKAYMACMFQGGWLPKYNIADEACIYQGCAIFDLPGSGDQVEGGIYGGDGAIIDLPGSGDYGCDDGGSMMTIIAGCGVGAALLIALLDIFLYCRKKRLAATADGDDDDDDEEKGKKGKKGKDKKGDKDKKDDKKDKKKDKEKKKDDSDDDDEDSDDKDSDDDDFDDEDVPNRIELPEKVVVVVVPPQLPSPWTPVVL